MKRYTCIFICLLFILFSAVGETIERDENNDGKTDLWITEVNGLTQEMKADTNRDGHIDYIAEYGEEGHIVFESVDTNHDQLMDDFYYYNTAGVLQRREIDSNFDEKVDIWVYIEEGVYISGYKRDKDYDGEVDVTKSYGPKE